MECTKRIEEIESNPFLSKNEKKLRKMMFQSGIKQHLTTIRLNRRLNGRVGYLQGKLKKYADSPHFQEDLPYYRMEIDELNKIRKKYKKY